jgi:ABC-type branched-subunit amino acid transport system substrate-binding protein
MMVLAACGSDRDDPPTAADDGTATTEADGGDAGEATFGDLESPCGEADGGGGGGGGGADPGVSADAITIGYGDDAGFTGSPGLNHQISDAVKALIEWCNEQGGINGRQIEGKYYDAKITEVNNAMLAACGDELFMLVGTGWALDGAAEETRLGCGLPSVPTYSVSPEFAHGPMMFQGVPNPADEMPVAIAHQIADMFPQDVKKVATMVPNYASTLDQRDKVLSAYPAAGWQFMPPCAQLTNILGEADWRPFALRLQECGAELVYVAGSPLPGMANYLDAAAQIGFDPVYVVDANYYDEAFAKWNTNGHGDKVHLRFAFVPFEEADDNPATKQYIELVEGSGGDISLLGAQATSSFLLWATAADRCGADLTRQCVLGELAKVTEWDAGGLHAPTNPGENRPPDCGVVLKLEGTTFVRVRPESPTEFECDPTYIGKVTGPVVDKVELNADRISTKFTG